MSIRSFSFLLLFWAISLYTAVGQSAPVVYTSYDQLAARMSAAPDETFILCFWATWSRPSAEQLPHLEGYAQRPNAKGKVLLVSLDLKNQMDRILVPYIAESGLKNEVVLLADPNTKGWIGKVNTAWDGSLPATIAVHGEKRYFSRSAIKSGADVEMLVKAVQ